MTTETFGISLDDLWVRFQTDPIWAIRGRAIDEFARLESFLCDLMATILGVPRETGAAIFYNMTAFRSRLSIMEDRLKADPSKYQLYMPFWRSLRNGVTRVNETRNRVVHWHSTTWISSDGEVQIRLFPGDYWTVDQETGFITSESMVAFFNDCNYYSRNCYWFKNSLNPGKDIPDDMAAAWREKCLQPIPYPPPKDVPPSSPPETPESPPAASEE